MKKFVFALLLTLVFIPTAFATESLSPELEKKAIGAYEESQRDSAELNDFLRNVEKRNFLCQTQPSPENCANATEAAVLHWARKSLVRIFSYQSFEDVLKNKELFSPSGWDGYIMALSRAGVINPEQKQLMYPSSLNEEHISFSQDYYNGESPEGYAWTIILEVKGEEACLCNNGYVTLTISSSSYLKRVKGRAEGQIPADFKIEHVISSTEDPRKD